MGRRGEELDAQAVDAWLKPRVPGLTGTPRVTQYSGGASNWTYRLEYPSHDLVLRRPPAGTKAKSAHDMGREYRVQSALAPAFPYVPEMIAHCEDAAVIGTEFYVMRRIDGIVPRARLGVSLGRDEARSLCLHAIDTLVSLHQVDPDRAGLASLGKGTGYARRQIEGWTERGQRAHTWNAAAFRSVTQWLAANTPDDVRTCVIHNDFRLDNLVLDRQDPTRVVGVLDWEMATLGDPLMDLGNSLAYWVESGDDPIARATRRQPTSLPGMLTRDEVTRYYCERMGLRPTNFAFYEVYGLFRLAVIIQQIYYRFHRGESKNAAFRHIMAHDALPRVALSPYHPEEPSLMAAIYLVRHSQASFGSSDYDRLSELGLRQATVLGQAFALRQARVSRVFSGTMRRHHQTASGCLEAMGLGVAWPAAVHDARWNEYDHDDVIAAFEPRYRDPASLVADLAASSHPRKAFQEMFVRACARWASGAHDGDYAEAWPAFKARVMSALDSVNAGLAKSEGALVFTSGGPIGVVCGALLHLGDDDTLRLSSRLANAAITKLVCSDGAIHLSTLNEHGHFEGEHAAMMTYR